MKIFKLIIILTLVSVLNTNCHTQSKEVSKSQVDPRYQKQYEYMMSVNSDKTVITAVVKDTFNRELKVNELSENRIGVIKLWARWCAPCIESMPDFQDLKEKYKDNKNLHFYTLAIDHSYEEWKNYISKKDWKVDHYWAGENEEGQIYHLGYELMDNAVPLALPNYVILDEKGMILENLAKDKKTKENLYKVVEKIASC
jgi:thiol-disulfide isomerase/thioredoxin